MRKTVGRFAWMAGDECGGCPGRVVDSDMQGKAIDSDMQGKAIYISLTQTCKARLSL